MNKQRRKEIQEVSAKIEALRDLLSEIKEETERIRDEEQDYYDNMPEGLQSSDRGYAAENAIDQLDNVVSVLDDFDIDELVSNLEEASE